MNRERLLAARRGFEDWLEVVDREQEALAAILEGLDELLELDRERAMAAELAEEMTPAASAVTPPSPVTVVIPAASPSRCETCNHTRGSHEAAGGGCRSGQCSCETFVGEPAQADDGRWVNGSKGTAQCTLCQRTMGYRVKWAHESVCTTECPLPPQADPVVKVPEAKAPRKPKRERKPGGCYRCHHAPGSHGSAGRGRCSSPNCECAWFAPTANELEVDPRGYAFARTGVMRCLECGFEARAGFIRKHVDGHKAQAAVAEKRANGEHIHRWKLDPPRGEWVHQACECGAEKDVPAMLGEIGRGTSRQPVQEEKAHG